MDLPRLSVIVPCREESAFIERALRSILANDYPRDRLEVLVVDGMSKDGSRDIVRALAAEHPQVRLLDNPRFTVPTAMNVGIAAATGDVVMKMDAHSDYGPDYIPRTVRALVDSGAAMVGGRVVATPADGSPGARAVAVALNDPWGSLGSHFRTEADAPPREVDAAAFGCWRRELFARVGGFDERLIRSSDIELNKRIQASGGRILLYPGIVARYYPSATLGSFWRKSYADAVWSTYPYRFVRRVVSARHLLPLAGLLVALVVGALALVSPWARVAFFAGAAAYALVTLAVSARLAARGRDARLALLLPSAFAARHWAYAAGSLVGLVRAVASRDFWTRPPSGAREPRAPAPRNG